MGDLAPLKPLPPDETPRSVRAPRGSRPTRISLAEARRIVIEFNEQINSGYRLRAQVEAEEEARWEKGE